MILQDVKTAARTLFGPNRFTALIQGVSNGMYEMKKKVLKLPNWFFVSFKYASVADIRSIEVGQDQNYEGWRKKE
jgi:hypothetical protein